MRTTGGRSRKISTPFPTDTPSQSHSVRESPMLDQSTRGTCRNHFRWGVWWYLLQRFRWPAQRQQGGYPIIRVGVKDHPKTLSGPVVSTDSRCWLGSGMECSSTWYCLMVVIGWYITTTPLHPERQPLGTLENMGAGF